MGEIEDEGGALLPGGVYARAWERMTDTLLTERDAASILESLARITGETLGVDRSLIFEVKFAEEVAIGLSEWLNPDVVVSPTKATYPLASFAGGDDEQRRTRRWLESHRDAPHPAFASDGSAEVLHGAMSIQSLLWYPFDFRDGGYYLLVFNQVTRRRSWRPEEIAFLRVVTRQVSLALLQISMHAERAQAERVLLEAQKAESIRVLASGVAHDFNSLFGIVLGALGRAQLGLGAGHPQLAPLRDAERATIEASVLAKHLLAFAGEGRFVVEAFDLAALTRDMQDLLRALAADVPMTFEIDGPTFVRADAGQLRQVLVNFVINAKEAVDGAEGHITVRVAPHEPDRVVLSVADDGRGMTDEVQRRMFDPFFSTKALGRGLGLAAVSGIVRTHGGEIRVDSGPGRGTTMTVLFPRERAPSPARTPAPAPRERSPALLLVDDNDNFRRTCADILSDLGYAVEPCADGLAATRALEASPGRFDVVLLDWTMPRLSGAETFQRLRALDAELPIVIMSGYAESVASDHVQLDLAAFLEKPFTVDALQEALSRVLGGS